MATIEKRRGKDGKLTYRVKIRRNGQPHETATFTRAANAREWAEQTEPKVAKGVYGGLREARRRTLAEAIDTYVAQLMDRKTRATQAGQRPQLAWWRKRLGPYHLAAVTATAIADAVDELAVAPPTKNRYLAALSAVLTYAVGRGWLETNPAYGVNRKAIGVHEHRGRVRFLSPDERTALLGACDASGNPYLRPAVLLALSTGMRKGEQFGLTWDRVDLKAGRLFLEHTKNGERRAVVVSGPALELLRTLPRRLDTSFVFPSRSGNPSQAMRSAWEAAVARAGLEDFRWHDLRHSFASELAMSGATLAELAEALGHRSLAMVKRYAHLGEQHQAAVVARMTERVFGGQP